MISFTNPKDQNCFFDEQKHEYLFKDRKLMPVTKFIEKFFPKFDGPKQAVLYAKKHGKSPEYWLKTWEEKGEKAVEKGHWVHRYAQFFIENRYFLDVKIYKEYEESMKNALIQLVTRFKILQTEYPIFSSELGLAGTVDLLVQDKKTKEIVIFDWKTNEKIRQDGSSSAFDPISHLDDSEYSKYSLQINLYQKILEHENYFPGLTFRGGIIHVTPSGANWIKVHDLQEEINNMLRWI